ncbi:alkaline phosphatase family protein [Halosimplex sp. TS25]|uniref:alkaline phosphatase family protein n=1 Tax=Halosimplex rarum TaxID=3396619 RepID=UPI0039E8B383
MLRHGETATLLERQARDGLVVPDYEGYCFANVPGTAGDVLGVDVGRALPADALSGIETAVSHVVVAVLDSLGWHRWRRDADDHRFLSRLDERGAVAPLTSVASASTAPAITSVHTGATPAEHGILGCDAALPGAETIVRPFQHDVRPDVAGASTEPPVEAGECIRVEPVYPRLEREGVETRVVQPAETLDTEYAEATLRGATQVAYDDPADGARTLRRALADARGPSYTYWYTPVLDELTHEYGPDSGAYHDALGRVTRYLSRALYDGVDAETAAETLLIVTADHGAIPLDSGPAGSLRVLDVEGIGQRLQRRGGDAVPPFGDPRACHLAVERGETGAVVDAVESAGATAVTRERARELELFGPADAPGWERCGDVIVTDDDRALVYPSMEKVADFAGIHGGFTPREMGVPFAAARLSELQ